LGDEKVVRLIGPGKSFGEALMFMGKPYIVTSQVLEDTLLLHIAKEGLFAQLDQRPVMARKMIASLSQRLYSLMSDVEAYSLRNSIEMVIVYLLKYGPQGDHFDVKLSASKVVIDSHLNLSPEHFSRILRELSVQAFIEVKGRTITILDLPELMKFRG